MTEWRAISKSFEIDELLNEISMSWQAVSFVFDHQSIVTEGPIGLRSPHLNVGIEIPVGAQGDAQLRAPITYLWHLVANAGVKVLATEEWFEMTFPCGCVASIAANGFPETVKLFDNRRPMEMTRYPADLVYEKAGRGDE